MSDQVIAPISNEDLPPLQIDRLPRQNYDAICTWEGGILL